MTLKLAIVTIGLLASIWLLVKLHVWNIRNNLRQVPKVPMLICEKGHLYPEDAALNVSVPELTEQLHLCPFCYDDNMKNAEKFK